MDWFLRVWWEQTIEGVALAHQKEQQRDSLWWDWWKAERWAATLADATVASWGSLS